VFYLSLSTSLNDVRWMCILWYKKLPVSSAPVRQGKLTVILTGMTILFVRKDFFRILKYSDNLIRYMHIHRHRLT
jgi:hypothetical protein